VNLDTPDIVGNILDRNIQEPKIHFFGGPAGADGKMPAKAA
jgi:hypothetical protein